MSFVRHDVAPTELAALMRLDARTALEKRRMLFIPPLRNELRRESGLGEPPLRNELRRESGLGEEEEPRRPYAAGERAELRRERGECDEQRPESRRDIMPRPLRPVSQPRAAPALQNGSLVRVGERVNVCCCFGNASAAESTDVGAFLLYGLRPAHDGRRA